MTGRFRLSITIISLVFASSVAALTAPGRAQSIDLNAVAKNVVQVAGVKENQIILLTSDPANFPFLEDLAIAIRAQGAFPLIYVTGDSYNRRRYSEVPAKYDSQPPLLWLGLYKMIDAQINVDYGGDQDFDFFARADQNRIATQNKAFVPALQLFYSMNRRYIEVGNGIFPSPPNATLFGVSQSALADAFWTGMNVDYTKIQARADALKAAVAAGSTMHVTNPNGTDITFGVKDVHFVVSAGSIPPDCNGASCSVGLPAGDLVFIPVPGTATGKIVFDNTFWGKDNLKGFTATFSAGKLMAMTSSADMTKVNAAYASGGEGRDSFTYVDIGVNDALKDIPNSLMLATSAAGSVTLGFGGNIGLGGTDTSPFAFSGTQPGCTVTVDGRTIIANGALTASI
ncbi:MAG: aminopeptidase [Candidatus Eremiobacteraeota bacterium]|nr:aminopeptidase [Candidatus Eremiobacteraeota bacterium]MBV8498873.1 aminopeptidase [Candidatus Eremiobacteraeota bacterium]